jgi:hypothetical protein
MAQEMVAVLVELRNRRSILGIFSFSCGLMTLRWGFLLTASLLRYFDSFSILGTSSGGPTEQLQQLQMREAMTGARHLPIRGFSS